MWFLCVLVRLILEGRNLGDRDCHGDACWAHGGGWGRADPSPFWEQLILYPTVRY